MHMKNEELKSRGVTVCISVCVRAWAGVLPLGMACGCPMAKHFTKCKLLSGSEKPMTTTEGSR